MVAPAEQQAPAMTLCPHWARFFQRPDGEWLAYCSEPACLDMDQARPGWRDHLEAPVAQSCQLGWPDDFAWVAPAVVTRYRRADGFTSSMASHFWEHLHTWGLKVCPLPDEMTDELWGRYIEAFLAWTPPAGEDE